MSYYYYVVERDPERLWKAVPSAAFDFLVSPVYGLERIARVELLKRDLYARHPGPKLWMTYEDISASPQLEFEKLLRFLAPYPVGTAAMEAALVQSGFDDMQKLDIEIGRARAARQYVRLGVEHWSGDVNGLNAPSGRGGGFRQLRPDLADAGVLCRDFPITAQLRRV